MYNKIISTIPFAFSAISFANHLHSKFGNEPLYSSLEGTFLSGLDQGVRHVSTNSEAVGAAFVVLALVSRREFSVAKDLIGLGRGFRWEL